MDYAEIASNIANKAIGKVNFESIDKITSIPKLIFGLAYIIINAWRFVMTLELLKRWLGL